MTANYDYVLTKCQSICPGGRILDYGCGGGEVVLRGRNQGLNLLGVEAFYAGGNSKQEAINNGLLGAAVFELRERGVIPFDDGHFYLVISNLDFVLNEIARVFKPAGRLLAIFPSREVIREGHCGVPMIHWLSKDSAVRYPYMCFMRTLGFGYFKAGKPKRIWARDFINWLDRYTFYRPQEEIEAQFNKAGLPMHHIEEDYIAFRLSRLGFSGLGSRACSHLLRPLTRLACRRLGGLVILAVRQ